MKKSIVWAFILLVIVAAVYRVIPNRPWGFAPHWAMALFAGAMIKDKKWAFALPVFSMFLSDLLYQGLFAYGFTDIPGFYDGQLTNYILFAGITCLGILMKRVTVLKIGVYSLLAPAAFFLVSNLLVWVNGSGLNRPKTAAGLIECYGDALPFFAGSIVATLVFSAVLFGGYYWLNRPAFKAAVVSSH